MPHLSRLAAWLARSGLVAGLLAAACAPAANPGPTTVPATQAATPAPAGPAAVTVPAQSTDQKTASQPTAKTTQQAAGPAGLEELTDQERRAVEEFYRGKTFTIVVGFSAGGGYDTYSRLLARHLGKYIPGNPSVIVENRTGAGSLVAANYIFNLAPKDGTQMGHFDEYLVLGQLAGKSGIEFDARQFNWVGNPAVDPPACVFRSDLGFESFDELVKSGREVVMGATGVGSQPYATPQALRAVTGANLRTVSGYAGTSAIRLAVEKGEVDGACWGWSSIKVTGADWFQGSPPYARVLVQTGYERLDDLKDVPLARELVTVQDKSFLLDIHDAATQFTRPYALPPGVPAERVKAIRLAFLKAFNDPEARAEAERSQLLLDPQSYKTIEQHVQTIFSTPPELVAEAAETLGLN